MIREETKAKTRGVKQSKNGEVRNSGRGEQRQKERERGIIAFRGD